MKKLIYYTIAIIALVSCNSNTDKTAELEKLKTQRDQLNTQIEKIEAEINPNGQAAETKAVTVGITDIDACIFNHFIQVQGTVDGDENIAVSPQMSGIVTAVYVTEGTRVSKGQVLAELDAQLTKQTLEELKTQLVLVSSLYEKQAALWEKKIGSEVQYLQAKTNKDALDQKIKTVEEQLAMTKIVSPISGTVESVPLRVGQMASPGSPTSTIRVVNMSVAKIVADVSEAYTARIKNGNPAVVIFPDLDKEIETKLNFTGRFIDPTNRTFKVECKFTSRDIELRANMVAYLKIKDYTNENAICIPVTIIQSDQNGKFVYVAQQNSNEWVAVKQTIKTGMDYNGTIEIVDGLNFGDKVISSGFQNMNPGEKIIF